MVLFLGAETDLLMLRGVHVHHSMEGARKESPTGEGSRECPLAWGVRAAPVGDGDGRAIVRGRACEG